MYAAGSRVFHAMCDQWFWGSLDRSKKSDGSDFLTPQNIKMSKKLLSIDLEKALQMQKVVEAGEFYIPQRP